MKREPPRQITPEAQQSFGDLPWVVLQGFGLARWSGPLCGRCGRVLMRGRKRYTRSELCWRCYRKPRRR